jgi:hypothetical protein
MTGDFTADTGLVTAPSSSEFDPLDGIVCDPDRQYWADRGLWEAYRASLALKERQERKRCGEIVRAYAEAAPISIRNDIFELAQRIEFPFPNKTP